MRFSLHGGLIEAGLAACITSFCLSPSAAFSQDANVEQATPTNSASDAAFGRIAQQQAAMLAALERVRADSEAAFNRYTELALTQFTLVEQSFTAQQQRDLQSLERFQQLTRNVVTAIIASTVLCILVLAWVPLWAVNRVSRKLLAVAHTRQELSVLAADIAAPENLLAENELQNAIDRLEKRLLSLETPSQDDDEEVGETPSVSPGYKIPDAPKIAMAVGDGAAIMFFPHELPSVKGSGLWRRQFARVKKLFVRSIVSSNR